MKLYDIFTHAISLPKHQVEQFINEACEDDIALKDEVNALLQNDNSTSNVNEWSELIANQFNDLAVDVTSLTGEQFGAFKLKKLIGQGGMGAVYLADRNDEKFEQKVAVKVINQQLESIIGKEALIREASFMAKLNHSNIGKVFDAGVTANGYSYIVMEFIEGHSISTLWADDEISFEYKLKAFCSLCDAVNHAHQMQVVHADLKPSNIFINTSNEVKVLDFGIARMFDSSLEKPSQAFKSYLKALTANYACPEVKCGELPNTYSDIYSLGKIFSDLLSLTPNTIGDKELAAIYEKTTQQNYQHRYPSVLDLKYDIERYLNHHIVLAYPASKWFKFKKFITKRHPIPSLTTVIIFSVVTYLASNLYYQHENLKIAKAESDLTVNKLSQLLEMADLKKSNGKELYAKDLLDNAKRLITEEENLSHDSIAKIKYSLANSYESLGLISQASSLLSEIINSVANLSDKDIAYQAGEKYILQLLYSNEFHLIQSKTNILIDNLNFSRIDDLPDTLAQSKFYHQYLNGVKHHLHQSKTSTLGAQHIKLLRNIKEHYWNQLDPNTKGTILSSLAGALLNQVPNGIEFSFEQIEQTAFDNVSLPLINEAIEVLEESIKWYELQDNQIAVIRMKMTLGRALIELDNFNEGKEHMESALFSLQKIIGKSHPNNIQFYRIMAGFFSYDAPKLSVDYALKGVDLAKNNQQVQPGQYIHALDALLYSLLNYGDFNQYNTVSNELFDYYLAIPKEVRTIESLHVVAKTLENYPYLFRKSPLKINQLVKQVNLDFSQFILGDEKSPKRITRLVNKNLITYFNALSQGEDIIDARISYLKNTLKQKNHNARELFFNKKHQLELTLLTTELATGSTILDKKEMLPQFLWSDKELNKSSYRLDVLLKMASINQILGNKDGTKKLLIKAEELIKNKGLFKENSWSELLFNIRSKNN